MAAEYIHTVPNSRVESISGHYVIEKEVRLPYKGREVLVALGYAMVDKSCCGSGGCRFANVPGYIVGWHAKTAADGSHVSDVEPIENESERAEISDLIDKTELYCQVNFF